MDQEQKEVTKFTVTVDRDACTSCGNCEQICPAVFKLDDEGISTVIAEGVIPGNYEDIREAALDCPSGAIIVNEGDDTEEKEE